MSGASGDVAVALVVFVQLSSRSNPSSGPPVSVA
jgi:hypothetical protein